MLEVEADWASVAGLRVDISRDLGRRSPPTCPFAV